MCCGDEVDEPLDHHFNHPNTPIYVAARLIQRFGMSTPPASYMLAVGGAFKSGAYEGFGKSKRGDLAATTAALLLADKAFKPKQQAVTHGSLREPS